MAQGQWVDIPGRGRRWRQPSGELMEQKPGLGFVQAQLSPVTNFLGSLFQAPGAFNVGRLQARPPMPGLPTDYKRTELAAGAAAERYRPGAGFPGQQAAAERAYQSEASRVAQLTAQDPELQRYEAARLKAVAPGATAEQVQSAEDIGMQMWAKANPTLAAKVKPGQSGYDAIQGAMAGQAASQGFGYQMPQQMIFTPPPGVNTPQGLPAVESIGPSATYGAQGIDIDPEMQKKFQALLNQAKS
jgi:hypothetical protein